jgi:predicted DNA-binding transcriptional regulator AlpA
MERFMSTTPILTKLLKPEAAAEFLGRSPSTLAKSRMTGTGPRFVKLGGSVRYDLRDLEAYITQATRRSTSESAR